MVRMEVQTNLGKCDICGQAATETAQDMILDLDALVRESSDADIFRFDDHVKRAAHSIRSTQRIVSSRNHVALTPELVKESFRHHAPVQRIGIVSRSWD